MTCCDTPGRSRYWPLILVLSLYPFISSIHSQSIWEQTYGGDKLDIVTDVITSSDQTYLVAGYTRINYNMENGWIFKLDNNGTFLWECNFGANFGNYRIHSLVELNDGNFMFAGSSRANPYNGSFNLWLAKTNSNGDSLWTKSFDVGGMDIGKSLIPTSDGCVIIVGNSYMNGYPGIPACWLIKVDAVGDTLWTRQYNSNFEVSSAINNLNSSLVLAGTVYDEATFPHAGIMIVDSAGQLVSLSTIDTMVPFESPESRFYDILETQTGGYLMTGYKYSNTIWGTDIWIVATDVLGDTLWTRSYGGEEGYFFEGYSTLELPNSEGFASVGYKYSVSEGKSNYYLIRMDTAGDSLWTRNHYNLRSAEGYDMVPGLDGGFLLAGCIGPPFLEDWDVLMLKTDNDGNSIQLPSANASLLDHFSAEAIDVYPNPSNHAITFHYSIDQTSAIRFSVYNIRGVLIWSEKEDNVQIGAYSGEWNPDRAIGRVLPSGVYFITLEAGARISRQKFILIN